jgi:hypothetical protein
MFLSKLRGRGCSTNVPRLNSPGRFRFSWSSLTLTIKEFPMNPILWIFGLVFRCRHNQMSRLFTIKGRTYQVCFKCGEEFDAKS